MATVDGPGGDTGLGLGGILLILLIAEALGASPLEGLF